MVKKHKSKLCREVFTTASEIARRIRHHKAAKYRKEVKDSFTISGSFNGRIAGQRKERQAQGGIGYAGLASPPSDELDNLYLSQPSSNLNPASCSAPAEGSQFKSDKLRVPQDDPVISSADSLGLRPHDPRPQGSDLDSGLSLDIHHGRHLRPFDTILESLQKLYLEISSADNLRFSPQQKVRRVQTFEDLFTNDTQKVQQEEDNDLIYFPPDSIQNSIRVESLQFQ